MYHVDFRPYSGAQAEATHCTSIRTSVSCKSTETADNFWHTTCLVHWIYYHRIFSVWPPCPWMILSVDITSCIFPLTLNSSTSNVYCALWTPGRCSTLRCHVLKFLVDKFFKIWGGSSEVGIIHFIYPDMLKILIGGKAGVKATISIANWFIIIRIKTTMITILKIITCITLISIVLGIVIYHRREIIVISIK